MREWLQPLRDALQRGEAAMLVHLVHLDGSGPRDPGAQMLVTERCLFGTIGGGELEFSATSTARQWLQSGRSGLQARALGPELGQCCGGAVTLGYELFAPADLAWIIRLCGEAADRTPLTRIVRIGRSGALRRDWTTAARSSGPIFVGELDDSGVLIREWMNPPTEDVWLFGSGHVGRAVVKALSPLDVFISWVDARTGQFPDALPPGVRCFELALPELIVEEASAGATFLVMTHSHQVDQTICEAVLRRGDFGYLGLIGSATKRARFRKRLLASGVAEEAVRRLTCPIGLPSIRSKEPAAIAASVAADLLIRRESEDRHSPAPVPHAA